MPSRSVHSLYYDETAVDIDVFMHYYVLHDLFVREGEQNWMGKATTKDDVQHKTEPPCSRAAVNMQPSAAF
jgi:hypothetical protein